MICIPEITTGFEYAKQTYAEFRGSFDTIKTGGWPADLLEMSTDGVYRVARYVYGDTTTKPVIYIDAGHHGSEWQPCHAVREFMSIILNPPEHYATEIQRLRSKFAFVTIPCVNPYGYEHMTRENGNGVDLNRNYDYLWAESTDTAKGSGPFSEPESQSVRDTINQFKPLMYISFHTHGTNNLGMAMHPGVTPQYIEMQKDALKSMQFLGASQTELIGIDQQAGPFSMSWASQIDNRQGGKIICQLPEVGYYEATGYTSEECDYQIGRMAVNLIFLLCLYAENYLTDGSLILQ